MLIFNLGILMFIVSFIGIKEFSYFSLFFLIGVIVCLLLNLEKISDPVLELAFLNDPFMKKAIPHGIYTIIILMLSVISLLWLNPKIVGAVTGVLLTYYILVRMGVFIYLFYNGYMFLTDDITKSLFKKKGDD